MDNQYITIREFAELAGVSKQTITRQTETRLREYVIKINGLKKIDVSALKEFYDIEYQPETTENRQPEPTETTETTESSQPGQPETAQNRQPSQPKTDNRDKPSQPESTEIIKILKDQIRDRDEEIRFLRNQIDRKDRQNEELTERLKELNELLRIEKQFSAVGQKQLIDSQAGEDTAAVPQNGERMHGSGIRGFFRRLWGS